MGDIVAAESDVVMLTPVMVLNIPNILDTTPTPTDIVASDMDLYDANCLAMESDTDSDSDNVL